jgi:4-hydroxy-tetrahydrodipicolinate synthase
MTKAALDGDYTLAKELHYKYFEIIYYLFVDGNPAGVKTVLKMLNVTGDDVRLPLVQVSENTYKNLEKLTAKLK